MILSEAIDKCKSDILYIGASNAYIFVGSQKDAKKAMQNASYDYYDRLREKQLPDIFKARNRLLENYMGLLSDLHDAQNRLKAAERRKQKTLPIKVQVGHLQQCKEHMERSLWHVEERIKTLLEQLATWKDFPDREVVNIYPRRLAPPFGTIIIIEGTELGKYWDLEEYVKGERKC